MAVHAVVRRHVARAILLDPSDRVLLFWLDPSRDPAGCGYWYLPGGGIQADETPEEAIVRELAEEAGIRGVEMGPRLVHLTGVRFKFGDRQFEQDEWHVLARSDGSPIGRGRDDDEEGDAVASHRWWTGADLASASAVVYPRHLARVVALVHDGAPFDRPLEIDDDGDT